MSKDILIWSVPRDIHARAVQWLLQKKGANVDVWLGSDFPSKARASILVHGNGDPNNSRTHLKGVSFDCVNPDVVWRRRSGAPMFDDNMHAGDKVVAINECNQYLAGLNLILDERAKFSVNPESAAFRARSKSLQLELAAQVGLTFPETLMSNDPKEVEEFVSKAAGDAIIKSFTCPTWKSDDKAYFSYSVRVNPALLGKPKSIQASPAIYQRLVRKQYEVRAFFAGADYLAVKLDSQLNKKSETDWRAVSTAKIPIKEIKLPQEVEEKCVELMRKLGVVTGSFDFAVTDSGEYVFFEINEQGQFLWMERKSSRLPCLQFFCDFLLSGDPEFKWDGRANADESMEAYLTSGCWDQSVLSEETESVFYQKRQPIDDSGRLGLRPFNDCDARVK